MSFDRVVVYGAGAVGSYLGARLAAVLPVVLIARQEHVEAIKGRGLFVSGEVDLFVPPGRIHAATGVSALGPGTLVLVTVKLNALEQAGAGLARQARHRALQRQPFRWMKDEPVGQGNLLEDAAYLVVAIGATAKDVMGAVGNRAGLPAVCVPNGLGARGLPTSIQFMGRAWEENAILAAARAYQLLTDWHTRHPKVD